MNKLLKSLVLIIAFVPHLTFGQVNTGVDKLTGRMQASVPLYSYSIDGKSFPVGLSYSFGGLKVGDTGGVVGIGWSLSTEGQIYRNIKGLPDDYNELVAEAWTEDVIDDAYDDGRTITVTHDAVYKLGWLRDNVAQEVSAFDGTNGNCTEENQALLEILDFKYKDTQPDEFVISFSGLSGKFVFDENGDIQVYPYSDLSIEPIKNTEGRIISFMITKNDGFKYTFSDIVEVTKAANKENGNTGYIYQRELELFEKKVEYISTWKITKIESPFGKKIKFSYRDSQYMALVDGKEQLIKSRSSKTSERNYYVIDENGDYKKQTSHSVTTSTKYNSKLHEIRVFDEKNYNPNERIVFDWNNNLKYSNVSSENMQYISGATPKDIILKSINVYTNYDEFDLENELLYKSYHFEYYAYSESEFNLEIEYNYRSFPYKLVFGSNLLFLKTITETQDGCQSKKPITFWYEGRWSDIGVFADEVDPWGYFNNDNRYENSIAFQEDYIQLPPKMWVFPDEPTHKRFLPYDIPSYVGRKIFLDGSRGFLSGGLSLNYGALVNIGLPDGGGISIEYEPNKFYNHDRQEDFYGGGIRVKKIDSNDVRDITDYPDEHGYSPFNILRDPDLTPYKNKSIEYIYADENGNSSGVINGLPQFAMPMTHYRNPDNTAVTTFTTAQLENDDNYKRLILRTPFDLNEENGSYVLYKTVKEKTEGNGYVAYNYDIPLQNGNTSIKEWQAPVSSFYRPHVNPSCEEWGTISPNMSNVFPFANHGYIGFENGLISDVRVVSEADILLKHVNYKHQRIGSVKEIYGVQLNYLPSVEFNYGDQIAILNAYEIIAGAVNVPDTITTTVFDKAGTGTSISTISKSYYNNVEPFLLSRSESVVDGITNSTEYSYSSDYPVPSSSANSNVDAIRQLQDKNIIVPVSVTSKRTMEGITTVIGAQITLYSEFDSYIQPSKELVLSQLKDENSFGALAISGDNIEHDPDFETAISTIYVDGNPTEQTNKIGDIAGSIWSGRGNTPIATVTNAKPNQVLVEDFESSVLHSLHLVPYELESWPEWDDSNIDEDRYSGAYSGLKSLELKPAFFLQSLIQGANKKDYVFRCRIKTSSAGTLTVNLSDVIESINFQSQPEWQEIFWSITLTEANTNSISIKISTSNDILIDEVVIHPLESSVQVFGYDEFGRATSITDTKGNSLFTEYDALGRVISRKDGEGNILSYTSYHQKNQSVFIDSGFDIDAIKTSSPIQFTAKENPCLDGLTHYWKFGNEPEFVGSESEMHTYNDIGLYSVLLRVEHPTYGSSVTVRDFEIKGSDVEEGLLLTVAGLKSFDTCSKSSINFFAAQNPEHFPVPDLPPNSCETSFMANILTGESLDKYTIRWERLLVTNIENPIFTSVSNQSDAEITLSMAFQSYYVRCLAIPKNDNDELPTLISNVMMVRYEKEDGCDLVSCGDI